MRIVKVIYIAGNGHSGSTLLDIILGQSPSHFSAGELTFISRESIFDEMCSCKAQIRQCSLWQAILSHWEATREISFEEYRILRNRFERNKSLPRLFINLIWPTDAFRKYASATQSLFQAIQHCTQAEVIIDSSKSALRIAVLRRFADLTIVHLCRNFGGYLNSVSKYSPKNIEKGIEQESKPTPTLKAFFDWVLNNMLVTIFSIGLRRHRVYYRNLIENGNVVDRIVPGVSHTLAHELHADHMLAGNILRLRPRIKVDSSVGFDYRNLRRWQIRVSSIVDRMFWFWAGK